MAEFNLAQAVFFVGPDDGKDFDGATPSTNPTTALHADGIGYGTVSIQPSRDTTRIPPAHNQRRGRVVASGAGGGTITISIVRDNVADPRAKFFDEVEASLNGRFLFAGQAWGLQDAAGAVVKTPALKASDENPVYRGHAVLTSLDVWGSGGDDPAVLVATAELDRDYEVVHSSA